MLDGQVLWAFFLLWLVIVPTPGANSMMVTHTALTRPAAHVAFAIVGNIAGILLLATLAMAGWAALLEAMPWLRLVVHLLCGAYLIYFGLRLLDRARQSKPAPSATADTLDRTEPGRALVLGFVTALSNAQAILFITSIFAVSGVLAANLATSLAVLGIMATCNVLYLGGLAWLLRRPRVRRGYDRARGVIEGTMGALFIGFGGRLIWRELAR
jgi:threonine/homoserine/homoserine lactone efflux protein